MERVPPYVDHSVKPSSKPGFLRRILGEHVGTGLGVGVGVGLGVGVGVGLGVGIGIASVKFMSSKKTLTGCPGLASLTIPFTFAEWAFAGAI